MTDFASATRIYFGICQSCYNFRMADLGIGRTMHLIIKNVSVFQSWCNPYWIWKHLKAIINGDHCDMHRSESFCVNSATKNPWSAVSIPRFKQNAKWNNSILSVLWIVELISFAIWFTLCHLRNSTTIEGSTIVSSSMKQMTHPRVDFTMYPWAHWTKRKRQHVSHRRLIRK